MNSAVVPPLDPDAARLAELGYRQELARRLRFFDNAAMGFATMSPVVGLYAVVLVGTVVAGPAWVWVLPVALAGQCLLLAVYAELASEFPIAGGAYQWTRRLMGASYGWLSGWVAICAYAAANATIAYLGAPWALALVGIPPTPNAIVATAMLLVLICAAVGALGIQGMGRAIKAGITPVIWNTRRAEHSFIWAAWTNGICTARRPRAMGRDGARTRTRSRSVVSSVNSSSDSGR